MLKVRKTKTFCNLALHFMSFEIEFWFYKMCSLKQLRDYFFTIAHYGKQLPSIFLFYLTVLCVNGFIHLRKKFIISEENTKIIKRKINHIADILK